MPERPRQRKLRQRQPQAGHGQHDDAEACEADVAQAGALALSQFPLARSLGHVGLYAPALLMLYRLAAFSAPAATCERS